MQARRPSAVPPLAIVLPHPSLPRRRSSLLSSNPPRTPRSCASPTCSSILLVSNNRKSTDSWNSSNQDEQESEWKPEQTLLLSRTLDALPAHLLTPFHGAIPPSNLLDKIARGVAQAKGPLDWPHSVRATRVKLLELARVRAKEERIAEEHGPEVLQPTTNTCGGTRSPLRKRPLYRQSSMDFMTSPKVDVKDNANINRLSNRLQRAERIITNPPYHPYSRPSRTHPTNSTPSAITASSNPHPRSSSPSFPIRHTSTPSATTPSSTHRPLSFSTTSSMSFSSSDVAYLLADPRVQRVRRSDSFCAPQVGRQSLKRAPSFGSTTSTSISDEEERMRIQKSKKARTKSASPPLPSPSQTPNAKRAKTKARSASSKSSSKSGSSSSARSTTTEATSISSGSDAPPRKRANLQRNPSIFGPELPPPPAPQPQQLLPTLSPGTIPNPQTRQPRGLRRMRVTSFARAPARRISFGSLVTASSTGESDAFAEAFGDALDSNTDRAQPGLGSAFQLR